MYWCLVQSQSPRQAQAARCKSRHRWCYITWSSLSMKIRISPTLHSIETPSDGFLSAVQLWNFDIWHCSSSENYNIFVRPYCETTKAPVLLLLLLLLACSNIEPLAHPGSPWLILALSGSLWLSIALRFCSRGHCLAPRLSTGRLPSQIDILATFQLLRVF